MFRSVAQYHKIHKEFPVMAGRWTRQTDMSKLPQRLTLKQGDMLVRYRGKLNINTKGK